MRKDRLTKLRDYMRDEMHPQLFDIDYVTAGKPFEPADLEGLRRNDPNCGSTCCVAGLLPILFPDEHRYDSIGVVKPTTTTGYSYNGFAEEFRRCMEISEAQAEWITSPGEYEDNPPISEVVARLDALLALEDGDGSVPNLD